uniref:SUEL-type lectin domain-containing protein n=1 Tax=Tetranychus urticae TaxID=32264 RepID=T1KX91_TETUR
MLCLLPVVNNNIARYKTVYACEDKILEIKCDEGYLIHLIRANYGRYSISICNSHGNLDWKVDCTSPHSYEVISKRCHSMRECNITVSSTIFEDHCPGTYKYLEVQYDCLPKVIHQHLGLCGQRNSCRVPASSKIFDDPCSLTFKYLEVHYQCKESVVDGKPWLSSKAKPGSFSSQDDDHGHELSSTSRPPIIVPITSTTRTSSTLPPVQSGGSINLRTFTSTMFPPSWKSSDISSTTRSSSSTHWNGETGNMNNPVTISTSAPWRPPKVSIITGKTLPSTTPMPSVYKTLHQLSSGTSSTSSTSTTTTLAPPYERSDNLQGIGINGDANSNFNLNSNGKRTTTLPPWLKARLPSTTLSTLDEHSIHDTLDSVDNNYSGYPGSIWSFASNTHYSTNGSSLSSKSPSLFSSLPENSSRTNRAQTTNLLVIVSISSLIAIIIYSITLVLLIISRITNHRQIVYKNICFILILSSVILCIISFQPWTESSSPLCNTVGILLHFLLQAIFNVILIDSIRVYCNTTNAAANKPTFSSSLSLISKNSITLYLLTYGLPIVTIGISFLIEPTLIYRGLTPGSTGSTTHSLLMTYCWFTSSTTPSSILFQTSLWVFLPTFLSIFFTALLVLLTIYGKMSPSSTPSTNPSGQDASMGNTQSTGLPIYGSNPSHYHTNQGSLIDYKTGINVTDSSGIAIIQQSGYTNNAQQNQQQNNRHHSLRHSHHNATNVIATIIFSLLNVSNAAGVCTITFIRNRRARHNVRKWLLINKYVPNCFKFGSTANIEPSSMSPLSTVNGLTNSGSTATPMTACFYSLDPSHLMSPPSPIIKLTSSLSNCSSSRLHTLNVNNNINHLHTHQHTTTLNPHQYQQQQQSQFSRSMNDGSNNVLRASQETLSLHHANLTLASGRPTSGLNNGQVGAPGRQLVPEVSPYAPPVPIYLHEYEDISSNLATDSYSFIGQPRVGPTNSYYYHTTRSPIYYSDRKQVSLDQS